MKKLSRTTVPRKAFPWGPDPKLGPTDTAVNAVGCAVELQKRMSGFPFLTIYVASSVPLPVPTFVAVPPSRARGSIIRG
jgi:hypothetical protein